jgi:hypothetical protein
MPGNGQGEKQPVVDARPNLYPQCTPCESSAGFDWLSSIAKVWFLVQSEII